MSGFLGLGDDDDMDFGGGKSSKLANLFGVDMSSSGDGGNQSLTYTAPRQPRKDAQPENDKAQAAPSALACLHAVPVNAFKLVNGQYASQGKVGAAVLGNHEKSIYNVILYRGKQQRIAMATVSPAFRFTVQANNYANFYDDQRQNWSLHFESADAIVSFAKNTGLVIANSSGGQLKQVVIQDLIIGEGNGLESNDSAEMTYTGWLLTNHTFGKVFDENKSKDKQFRLKLGKGKVIKGWEEGLIGAKKGGQRLLVIPPSHAYGPQGVPGRIPQSATLIFEIDVNKVKLSKERSDSRAATPQISDQEVPAETKPALAAKPRSQSVKSNENIRARGESIAEQLSSSPKTNKAKIISRMAKMGQPMIPLDGAIPAQPSDESSEDEIQAVEPEVQKAKQVAEPVAQAQPKPAEPKASTKTSADRQPKNSTSAQSTQDAMSQRQVSMYQPNPYQHHPNLMMGYQTAGGNLAQPGMLPQSTILQNAYVPMPPANPASNDSHTAMLMSENRTQNTELRLHLSKITDKIDNVLTNLNELKMSSSSSMVPSSGYPSLEPTILLHSITKIVQENTSLKTELDEKRSKMETQNEKISELLHRNQKFIEQSNDMFERKNDSLQNSALESQSRILHLEKEKSSIALEMNEVRNKLISMQSMLNDTMEREQKLKVQLASQSSDTTSKDKMAEYEEAMDDLKQSLKKEMQARKDASGKLTSMEETVADLQSLNGNLEKAMAERKSKLIEQKNEFEKQIEDLKSMHEADLKNQSSKLPQDSAKTSVDEDAENKWKAKYEKLLADSKLEYESQIKNMNEEQNLLIEKSKQLENKLEKAKVNEGKFNATVSNLEDQVQSLSGWQEKYETFHHNVVKMKQKYEDKIKEIASSSSSSQDSVVEVKKVMNAVFKQLQAAVDADESYSGQDVLQMILNVIRETTVRYVEQQSQKSNADENDSEQGVDEVDDDLDTPGVNESSDGDRKEQDERIPSETENDPQESSNVEITPEEDVTQDKQEIVDNEPLNSDPIMSNCDNETEIVEDGNLASNEVQETSKDLESNSDEVINDEKNEDVNINKITNTSVREVPPPLWSDDEEDDDAWLK